MLGVKISSDLTWSAHVNDLCLKLYQRLSMLRRIKHKVDPSKLRIIAEAIFNSKIRSTYNLQLGGHWSPVSWVLGPATILILVNICTTDVTYVKSL